MKRMSRRKVLILLGILAAVMLSACSSPPQTVDISLTEFGIQSSQTTFKAGELEFACHLAGHYEAGMFAPFSVEAG